MSLEALYSTFKIETKEDWDNFKMATRQSEKKAKENPIKLTGLELATEEEYAALKVRRMQCLLSVHLRNKISNL
ncbi:MAG: hypothetical protein IJ523_05730 [Succinivibrionaceae bacterium]|nr:hypothetical protein [Succinivibrionaceae bacterium]